MRLSFSFEIGEFAEHAGTADSVLGHTDRLEVTGPNVAGNQTVVERFFAACEKLEGFPDFERGDEIDDGPEDTDSVTGFFEALAVCGGFEEASETGSQARADGHGYAVTGDGGGVNPGASRMNGKIVDEKTSLKVVRAIEDEIETFKQLLCIVRV